MANKNINALIATLTSLAAKYDRYVDYIDNYQDYQRAIKNNDGIIADFVTAAAELGATVTKDAFCAFIRGLDNKIATDEDIQKFINTIIIKEDTTMKENAVIANTTNNTAVKEEKKVNNKKSTNDYTLGGRLSSNTWTEFVAVCRSRGINCGSKKFVVLKSEMEEILAEDAKVEETKVVVAAPVIPVAMPVATPVIPMVTPVVIPEVKGEFVLTKNMGNAIARRIVLGGVDRNGKAHGPAMFVATKSKDPEVNGRYMVTMAKLYGIIADVYGLGNDAAKREENDAFIKKGVINYLCKHGWLAFRKYESGGVSFFPTQKMLALKF